MIGMAPLQTASMPKIDRLLARIQNDLFDLGSDLATQTDPMSAICASRRASPNGWSSRSTISTKA